MLIRGHDLQKHTVEEFEKLEKLYGITGYQLAIKKSYLINESVLTDDSIKAIDEKVLYNTKILGAYFNPVHPDVKEIECGIENFIFNMKLAEKYGIEYVGTETGSVLGSPWDYHPDNHSEEIVDLATSAFEEIAERTIGIDVNIAVEPAYHHVIKDVDSLIEMNMKINDSRVVYILDLFNLLKSKPYEDYKATLLEFLDKAGNKTKIIHIKDFVIEDNMVKQVRIGDGIIDFEFFISQILKSTFNPLFVLEGTLEEDLTAATNLVSKFIVN